MTERIDNLRAEASAAIAGAADTAGLEELRVRYLGRKSELTAILRGIADLDPAERGPVGAAANAGPPSARGRAGRARGRAGGRRARELARGRRDRRHDAGRPAGAERGSEPARPHPARDRGRVRRPRLPGDGGARGRARLLQLHRAQPPAGTPGADGPGHVLRRPRDPQLGPRDRGLGSRAGGRRPADAHLADAGALDGEPGTADHDRLPGALLSLGPLRRDPQPDLPPGRGPGRRRGDHARRPQGDARRLRARDLRPRARDALPARASSRSPSRASRSTSPASGAAAAASCPTARAIRSARAWAGSRSSARGWSTRTCSASSPRTATTPSASRASRSAWAIERIAMLKHGVPDLRKFFENDVRVLRQFR